MIEAAAGSQSEPGETRRYESDSEFSDGYGYRRTRSAYGQTSYGRGASARSSYGRTNSRRPGAASRASKDPLIGTRVQHSKYGIGTVIEVEGEGEERKLTVSFQDYGPKKLLERYANLRLA